MEISFKQVLFLTSFLVTVAVLLLFSTITTKLMPKNIPTATYETNNQEKQLLLNKLDYLVKEINSNHEKQLNQINISKTTSLNILTKAIDMIHKKQKEHSEAMVEILAAARMYKNSRNFEVYRKSLQSRISSIKNRRNNKNVNKNKKSSKFMLLDEVAFDTNINYRLVIMVTSNAPNIAGRHLIRTLWGNGTQWKTTEPYKIIFVLGGVLDDFTLEEILTESQTYHDIILESVPESFYSLANKLSISLHWLAQSNARFEFLLKCDDDVFVHIDHMMAKITSGDFQGKHYVGDIAVHQPVDRTGRYKLSKEEYSEDVYAPYVSGGGFVLSSQLLQTIVPFLDFYNPIKIDDAYLGLVVQKHGGGVVPENMEGFSMYNDKCKYDKHLLVSHPARDIYCMYTLMKAAMKS